MSFPSIRVGLLFWYALVLVASLATLAWVLHEELDRGLYAGADRELTDWMATAQRVAVAAPEAELPTRLAEALPDRARVELWGEDGRPLVFPEGEEGAACPTLEGSESRDHARVSTRRRSDGGWIRISRSIEVEHDRIRAFLNAVILASLGIVVLALGGGWFLVGRSLAPIRGITATAQRISGDNLRERIDTERIHNELGALAQTLNESFDRLEAAIERQARFTADASHELRTPLAIVCAHLELAETEDRSAEDLRERIGVCREGAGRMRGVVDGLLTLARADAGELELERGAVELAAVVEAVCTELQPLAAARGVDVERALEPVTLGGDADRLREVVSNLVANALHHERDGGRVAVRLHREQDDAVLEVSDTGIGIAAADQPRVFERFFRVDPARSRRRGGSGLGLAIAREIVELHGGRLSVESEPGRGSTFTARLPGRSP